MIWIIMGAAIWYVIGVYCHVYWWRRKYDFYTVDIFLSLLMGFGGPINFVIYGKPRLEGQILLHKKNGLPPLTET